MDGQVLFGVLVAGAALAGHLGGAAFDRTPRVRITALEDEDAVGGEPVALRSVEVALTGQEREGSGGAGAAAVLMSAVMVPRLETMVISCVPAPGSVVGGTSEPVVGV
ncbi:hypothetical protein GCM10029992_53280 [Glycomyces albus]